MNSSSFEEAVQFALEKLHMEDLHPREEQLQSIKAVYDGLNVFVCLPTGFGKSLCYQAIPFVMDFKLGRAGTSITSAILVVSPLVSLMVDQVEDLRRRKVKTSFILLFCAPEALALPKWRAALETPAVFERIVAVVVDEAHCVSKW